MVALSLVHQGQVGSETPPRDKQTSCLEAIPYGHMAILLLHQLPPSSSASNSSPSYIKTYVSIRCQLELPCWNYPSDRKGKLGSLTTRIRVQSFPTFQIQGSQKTKEPTLPYLYSPTHYLPPPQVAAHTPLVWLY